MIKPGQIIKHRNAMDVCLLVDDVSCGPDQQVEITGDWINMGFVESFLIHQRSKFRTTLSGLNDWQICKEPITTCLRYAEWL